MSRIRLVGGTITKTTGGDHNIYSEGNIVYNSGQAVTETSDTGIKYGDPKDAPVKEVNEAVKEIELITKLDQGSANDKTGTFQDGMIFGKTYHFKVKSYVKDSPKNKLNIKWILRYHSLADNSWKEISLSQKGESLKITMNEEDMCGRFIYIRAYVKDHKTEAELKVWKHNRFRWFDRMLVEEEIKDRTDNNQPWKIDQAGTSLCGMACIFYLFAKEQPAQYKKIAKELFRTGISSVNNFTVKPDTEILEKMVNKSGFPMKTSNMPAVDYITMASTRNTDNPKYKGGDEEFQAINWPPLMTKLSEKFLGYKDVYSKGIYNPVKPLAYTTFDIQKKIDDINEQFNAGYKLILMIDSDLISDVWDVSALDLHWVVLESPITWNYIPGFFTPKQDEIDFKVYTWGTNPNGASRYLKKAISSSHFMNNYNGYIKCK
ncbi:hypothetical protein [Flavobacterium johnsoniae]|uniref:hypothetical protein n=1 Tax=Flavobacterium johnsoniae TaxID=986 RepID=UPI0011EEC56D|nr:hypothetical protein [Flavobacterium johnsoniae]